MLPHQFFKLLADETRMRCLLLIAREQRLCVCELTHALDESQPKISRHLAQLRQSGVLTDERQGQWVYYKVSDQLPGWLNKIIDGLKQSNCLQQQYSVDTQRLSDMTDRPSCC
ncbi:MULTISPECIES: metalloregulator ArsR/SmtB family transcription factor [Vibrio]|jgi:ArsR family transcriptional regulator|uniref:metalloregulator ArsR/SmtB family transcription factor n=1 Tax=Vibrio TaxID=662 RepID=UPI0005A65519|nr:MULTISPECIES: metalloregulator ArsR/SmtB family transcription factor [Vibrio]MCF7363499.1 metalloregulator ArsR/SmtB family transcription factor [Vibrio sp. A1-b2]PNH80647.1 transcriptional regulator [Vibrio diazotrophicus]PNH91616.1 transcriptional regulator [Vibrio diazotrophicus]